MQRISYKQNPSRQEALTPTRMNSIKEKPNACNIIEGTPTGSFMVLYKWKYFDAIFPALQLEKNLSQYEKKDRQKSEKDRESETAIIRFYPSSR